MHFHHPSIERRDLAMICGNQGRIAKAENLISQHARFLLDFEKANVIINNLEKIVEKKWYQIARSVGVSDHDCETIASAFVYDGFKNKNSTR